MGVNFTMQSWCGYLSSELPLPASPQVLDTELATDVSFLPPLSRRRLSRLSKLSLRLARQVAPDYQGYCVFGSQHGELVTTQSLLEGMVKGELMSPAGFSASVHNTAAGLHSIHQKNTWPCTSIAAGTDTLPACFMEAYALLCAGAEQVLLVYADDKLPSSLSKFSSLPDVMQGFAALLKPENQAGIRLSLTHTTVQTADKKTGPVEALLAFMLNEDADNTLQVAGEVMDWRWQAHA